MSKYLLVLVLCIATTSASAKETRIPLTIQECERWTNIDFPEVEAARAACFNAVAQVRIAEAIEKLAAHFAGEKK